MRPPLHVAACSSGLPWLWVFGHACGLYSGLLLGSAEKWEETRWGETSRKERLTQSIICWKDGIPRAINAKLFAWIFTLSPASTGCKEESVFPPDNGAGALGGQRYNCMCNMQQERGSHLHNYPINVHSESQPLQIRDTCGNTYWCHKHLRTHKCTKTRHKTQSDTEISLRGGSQFTFTFSLSSQPGSIWEQSPGCQSKCGYTEAAEKSMQRSLIKSKNNLEGSTSISCWSGLDIGVIEGKDSPDTFKNILKHRWIWNKNKSCVSPNLHSVNVPKHKECWVTWIFWFL